MRKNNRMQAGAYDRICHYDSGNKEVHYYIIHESELKNFGHHNIIVHIMENSTIKTKNISIMLNPQR
jgi:hypothetical protein